MAVPTLPIPTMDTLPLRCAVTAPSSPYSAFRVGDIDEMGINGMTAAQIPQRCSRVRGSARRAYLGGILMPPSTRTTSAFMYELVISSITIDASSSGLPRRCGNSTDSPSFALNASDASPSP